MNDPLVNQVQQEVMLELKQKDGIPQIVIGIFIMLIVLLIAKDGETMFVCFIPFIPMLIEGLRKHITYPRIGYARIDEKKKIRPLLILLIALLLSAGIVGYFASQSMQVTKHYNAIIFHIFAAVVAGLILFLLLFRYRLEKNPVYLFYAIFILALSLALLVFHLSRTSLHLGLFIFGCLNIVYGIIRLVMFVMAYPVLRDIE